MPTPDEIRAELTDVLGLVAAVEPAAVRDTALLKNLGIDSVAIVELAEGVATRFDIELDDDSVNEWRTVGDVVRTVNRKSMPAPVVKPPLQRSDDLASMPPPTPKGSAKPATEAAAPVAAASEVATGVAASDVAETEVVEPHTVEPEQPGRPERPMPEWVTPERMGLFKKLALLVALVGAGLGVILGVAGAALLAGIVDGGSLPPVNPPSGPTTVASDATDPYGAGTSDGAATSRPDADTASLTATPGIVSAGDRFRLSGRLPNATPGETLTIEWREAGATWAPFPVTATARDDGTFETQVYIGSPGEREFRVSSRGAGGTTPPTMVRIS